MRAYYDAGMTGTSGTVLRTMTLGDVAAGLRLCRAARWNQTERDWRHFLTEAPAGALVAEASGSVIGTVATLPYGPFAWISMVLVDPAARGKGVGTTLLESGLALVPDDVVARLDATPLGEPIYRKLGFVAEYGLQRWFLDGGHNPGELSSGVRRLVASDWPAILDIDRRAFGAPRARLFERLASDAPEYAWIADGYRGPRGYLFGRHGHVREHLGPLVASDEEAARVLLEAGLAAVGSRSVIIDIADRQETLRDHVAALGFAVERPFQRMYRGHLATPGDPSLVFAIAGPEFG
jgi:ribosomal protein S18 acetylase RimI-like enzyme